MKHTILAAAIAALSIGTSTAAPQHGGYQGIGGSAAVSSASTATTTSGNFNTGNGYQVSGATAYNTTSAGASVSPAANGTAVNAHTASSGATQSWSYGEGVGTSEALAAQGGIASANANSSVGDRDRHGSLRGHGTHQSTARGDGFVSIDSAAAQGSVAASANNGTGDSIQWSGAGAENNTSGYVTVDADAGHNTADIDLTAGVSSAGSTYAYGNGYVSGNGVGLSGGIAGQEGDGYATARGAIGNTDGSTVHVRYPHGNHYHTRHQFVVNNTGTGYANVEADVGVSGFSAAGNTGTHTDNVGNRAVATNDATAGISNEIAGNSMTQTTGATDLSYAGTAGGGIGNSYGTTAASADGSADAFGTFNGNTGGHSVP